MADEDKWDTAAREAHELARLREFFKSVAILTVEHHGITISLPDGQSADYAVVYPSDLDKALSRVDPGWAKKVYERP